MAAVAATNNTELVQLHLYDLTRGMASALSPMLLGKQIAGIWHSGIVVHGREYFFGYGISSTGAGRTPFGAPDMVVCLGATEVPPEMVEGLVGDLRERFRPEHYNLLNWNCNHFTSEMAQLLTGEDIPDFVRDQAKEVMDTPLGRQFAPMILQLEGITSQAHAAGFGAPPAAAAATAPAAVASTSDGSAGATQRASAANVTAFSAAGGGGAAAASTAGVSAAAAAGAAAASRAAAAAAGDSGGAGTAAGASDLVQGVSSLKIEGDGGDESQVASGAAGASSAS